MNFHKIFEDLKNIGIENVLFDEPMAKYITFKVGGKSKILVKPSNIEEIKKVIKYIKENNIEYKIMGNGSNTIVRDEGYNGVIIKLGKEFNNIEVNENIIIADSGALIPLVSRTALNNNLSGLEFCCGIPGSVGGAIITNIGAYTHEFSTFVEEVEYLDGLELKKANKEECKFGYRTSFFENKDYVILRVKLKLNYENQENIKAKMKLYTEKRTTCQPVNYPSAGSIFKNPPNDYSARLIDSCGLKGFSVGGAKVSEKHAGYIINYNNATAKDIIDLIKIVQNKVNTKYGILLEPEVKII